MNKKKIFLSFGPVDFFQVKPKKNKMEPAPPVYSAERWQDDLFFALDEHLDRDLVAVLEHGAHLDRIELTNPLIKAIRDHNDKGVEALLRHGAVLHDTDMARKVLGSVLGVAVGRAMAAICHRIVSMLLEADEVTRYTVLTNGILVNIYSHKLINVLICAGVDIYDIGYTRTHKYHHVPVDSIYYRTKRASGLKRAKRLATAYMARTPLLTTMLRRVDFTVASVSGGDGGDEGDEGDKRRRIK